MSHFCRISQNQRVSQACSSQYVLVKPTSPDVYHWILQGGRGCCTAIAMTSVGVSNIQTRFDIVYTILLDLCRWVVAAVDSVPIDRALTDVNYTRLGPIENEWQTFYPLGAIFETVHMEAPPPQKPQGGSLTTVRVTKRTTTGPVRRLQVMLLLHSQGGGGGGKGGGAGGRACTSVRCFVDTSNCLPEMRIWDREQIVHKSSVCRIH